MDSNLIEKIIEPYNGILKEIVSKFSISPDLITAIILTETMGKDWTPRYEENFHYLYMPQSYADKLGISLSTEINLQKFSWGAMQIMGGTAREEGFDDHLPRLCLPENGILCGARHLSKLLNKYTMEEAISAYNQGSPRRDDSGKFINQHYVDKVINYMKILHGQ